MIVPEPELIKRFSRWWLVDFIPSALALAALAAISAVSHSAIVQYALIFSVMCFCGYNCLLFMDGADAMLHGKLSAPPSTRPKIVVQIVVMLLGISFSFYTATFLAGLVEDAVHDKLHHSG